jgi:hypothetical protein
MPWQYKNTQNSLIHSGFPAFSMRVNLCPQSLHLYRCLPHKKPAFTIFVEEHSLHDTIRAASLHRQQYTYHIKYS